MTVERDRATWEKMGLHPDAAHMGPLRPLDFELESRVFAKAAEIVSAGYCNDVEAVDSRGESVDPEDPGACAWSIESAIWLACRDIAGYERPDFVHRALRRFDLEKVPGGTRMIDYEESQSNQDTAVRDLRGLEIATRTAANALKGAGFT